MRYALGLPTCNRPAVLQECVSAFNSQSLPPDRIFIVNNGQQPDPVIRSRIPITWVENRHPTKGPEQAHQACLDAIVRSDFPIAVRWDDDLIPGVSCMHHLASVLEQRIARCSGGCYYREGAPVWRGGPFSGKPPPNGNWNHLQFYRWIEGTEDCHCYMPRSLYSGFMYHVQEMVMHGGFCTDYSRLGYRGETDASLRMRHCAIVPQAIALHKLAPGGVRDITDRRTLEMHDHALFLRRMQERRIFEGKSWIV